MHDEVWRGADVDLALHAVPGPPGWRVVPAADGPWAGPDVRDAVVVDTTPPPLATGPWDAVRVLTPGALRLEPAAFPIRAARAGKPERHPYPGW